MNSYDKMKMGVLRGAKAANDYFPVRVHELALQYGIDQRHVREKLVQMHNEMLIKLSAWNDQESREKPFDEWQNAEYFFAYASDGQYKRVRILVHGAEWLEGLPVSESSTQVTIQQDVRQSEKINQSPKSGDWEEIGLLGEGGQSKVFLVRTPERVADRARSIEDIRIAEFEKGHQYPLLANAIWSYARPDLPSELGALKRFKIRDGGAPAEKRLKSEIAILKEKRPGLPKLLGANETEQWMVTEYFPGKTLAHYPEKYMGQPLTALRAFRTLVETVANSLHNDGIVHRDVKPANVFIGENGMLVPGDFGIVFIPGQDSRPTVLNERVGPWEYMPPWADTGTRLEDVRPDFDVYMLGKLLWCMISGRARLPREDHREAEFDLEKKFPKDRYMRLINSILDRCLVKKPENCLRSAGELLPFIDDALASMEIGKPIRDFNDEIVIPCRICGRGFYHQNREGLSVMIQQANDLNQTMSPIKLRVYVCDVCQDRSFFDGAALIRLTSLGLKK